jgi:hypothetical protein
VAQRDALPPEAHKDTKDYNGAGQGQGRDPITADHRYSAASFVANARAMSRAIRCSYPEPVLGLCDVDDPRRVRFNDHLPHELGNLLRQGLEPTNVLVALPVIPPAAWW